MKTKIVFPPVWAATALGSLIAPWWIGQGFLRSVHEGVRNEPRHVRMSAIAIAWISVPVISIMGWIPFLRNALKAAPSGATTDHGDNETSLSA